MDIITGDRRTYQRSASGITVLAHLLGLTALVLMLIWLLHYREGLDLDSENPARVFNVNFLNFHIHFEIILFPVSFFFVGVWACRFIRFSCTSGLSFLLLKVLILRMLLMFPATGVHALTGEIQSKIHLICHV